MRCTSTFRGYRCELAAGHAGKHQDKVRPGTPEQLTIPCAACAVAMPGAVVWCSECRE